MLNLGILPGALDVEFKKFDFLAGMGLGSIFGGKKYGKTPDQYKAETARDLGLSADDTLQANVKNSMEISTMGYMLEREEEREDFDDHIRNVYRYKTSAFGGKKKVDPEKALKGFDKTIARGTYQSGKISDLYKSSGV